jgi:hypothetical protein
MSRTRIQTAALLLAMAFSSALSLHGAANYVVGGVVVDSRSHTPLARVQVSLASTAARNQKLEQVTKQDGRFSFAVSQAGKYTLQIVKPGYPPQDYQQASFAGISSAIVVRDDQDTSHIMFQANRGSAISGQIKDEDSDPVGNALVYILQSSIVGGERKIIVRGQTTANAAGEFRVWNLPRGSYFVCALGRPWFTDSLNQLQAIQESIKQSRQRVIAPAPAAVPSESIDDQPAQREPAQSAPKYSPDPGLRGAAFLPTFYPHGQTFEEASLVRLDAGAEAQVSITLPFTTAVSVKGKINALGEMSEGRANFLKKVSDQYVFFAQEWISKEGVFEFKNVPAGSYQIVANSQSGSGASSWHIRQEVEVGSSDMEVALRPRAMGSVSGRVLFEGERPASTATLYVSVRNDRGNLDRAEVDPQGSFSLSRLPEDHYDVTAGSADYVAAYFIGPAGQRMPLTLEIASGETVHRDLMLTKAVSVIEGTVEKDGAPQAGVFVLLMPKIPSQRWAYRVDQTDSDGSYRLATIPSGDYSLIALSEGTDVAYRDATVAAILSRAGKLVHVEPGDHLDMKVDVVGTATLHLPANY